MNWTSIGGYSEHENEPVKVGLACENHVATAGVVSLISRVVPLALLSALLFLHISLFTFRKPMPFVLSRLL